MDIVIEAEPERDAISATTGHALIGPGSIPWEVGNAFTAMIKRRRIEIADAQRGLEIFASIPVRYVEVDLVNALSIAAEANIACDAYNALAVRSPLLTLDRSLSARRAASAQTFTWRPKMRFTHTRRRDRNLPVCSTAESGKVLIRGEGICADPERADASPLDVPSVKGNFPQEIVTLVRRDAPS